MIKAREPAKAKRAPKLPPKKSAPRRSDPSTYALLVRQIPLSMRARLDSTRANRGLRSINTTILALLDEGAEK